MTNKWIALDSGKLIVQNTADAIDKVCDDLKNLSTICDGDARLQDYKKRKLIKYVTTKYFIAKKGPLFSLTVDDREEISNFDDYLKRGDVNLDNFKFKKFNLKGGIRTCKANLHPLLKMRHEYVQILRDMGFQAMSTNNYVESSFWNFDALFQPQDHPARDAHDTFFLSGTSDLAVANDALLTPSVTDPIVSDRFPQEYLHRVQQVHSHGGYGSQGYRNEWKLSEAQKNIMRTHTTAVSARMLYKLAQQDEFKPVKYFSIDRVFRNESLDATHLAEFHQVEGLIADRGLSLMSLKVVIREFFRRLGMDRVRFKPAYNPYTEPSMEIFGWHEGLARWIEIGNSGMFRPEMLLPMGLPEDVNVIAWGLSLERPTMIKYGINNIREMMGPRMDLKKVFNNPLCRIGH